MQTTRKTTTKTAAAPIVIHISMEKKEENQT